MWQVADGGYQTWPGRITATNEPYDFYVTIAGGPVQGAIYWLDAIVDMPDLIEQFQDVVIDAAGTRLPITQSYRAIKYVQSTVQSDGNGAVGLLTIDKNPTLGPLVKGVNDAGAYVQALGDFTIGGY
jgi:hypothetical protein